MMALIEVCGSIYRRNVLSYKNLYGFTEDSSSVRETLSSLANGALKYLYENKDFIDNKLKDSTPELNQEYDFIIVGGGTAGATVASRLSEIKDVTVLLIEAGPSENIFMDMPLLAHYLQFSNDLNWKFHTERSNSYCRGMKNQRCSWPKGKVMGGSSALNYMIATRGIALDYDRWAAMGNDGWSSEELLKYFKKLENIEIKNLKYDRMMHSTKGPVHINYPPYHTPLAESFLEAGLEMRYPIIDYNANQDIGFSYIQCTMINGTRMSTNRAYLNPASKRKNLFLSRLSHVNKVLINSLTKRAYGVDFTKLGVNYRVRARKEIILCAGAIGSAQILMLSGVGPVKHLNEMNIQMIHDSPIGENLMDHVAYGGLIFLVDQPISIAINDTTNPLKPYLKDFFNRRIGPYTVPGGYEALAFVNFGNHRTLDGFPDVELLFIGTSIISDYSLRNILNISDEYWNKIFSKIAGHHSWTILPILMHPNSKGKVLLRNKDPKSKPKIFANYFEDPEDVKIMIKGIRTAIEISKTRAMLRFNSKIYNFAVPGCEHYEYDSNKYWECALRTFTFTMYDYSGTCKMGADNDATGVVNPKLQVKGIRRLRVADASIMPKIITGHTNIPVIMIGEKVADMIKDDWGYDKKCPL
ncbi:PREDICTED: glucose dehydrogenase [FAD, quinone]-like [Ceratosolen solmsi marchali]|uniref:Glucose dehydrogenase [FAD, quinone]-like n=1 Tax=Ceratosolen solmsi marchali TaxID=326594 RepID=A0AAJ7DV67_9HYME|nr:PREDICTED: glucose dehydrogenase [FAD, quinone]-like [Ceratosolen solmsi marchali]